MKYLLTTILIFWGAAMYAQSPATEILPAEMDAVERMLLKDSLGLTDSQVNGLFAIRNRFFEQCNTIYGNNAIAFSEQQVQVKALRKQCDEAFSALLGASIYKRYTDLISVRFKNRKRKNPLPLTLDSL